MDGSQPSSYVPSTKAEFALLREEVRAEGRYEAFLFAVKCRGDPAAIRAKIQEEEELISQLANGPLALGASPRIYTDAFIAALRDALRMIADADEG